MITYTHTVAGEDCRIYFPERPADLFNFEQFIAGPDKVLALDSETTGLDIFSPGHKLRLVQLGNSREAWVLRADMFAEHIRRALAKPRHYVAHNLVYDALVLDRHLGIKLEDLGPRCYDTRTLAHLLDPRAESEGGLGLGLKALSSVHVDPTAVDTANGLTAVFRSLGFTKATGWAGVPIDHETYVRYAGLDVIYTHRLFRELAPIVRDVGLDSLSRFEHHLALLLAILQRRGMKIDVAYTERLRADLLDEAERFKAVATRYGVDNVNSTAQVAAALEAMGETLTETTPSGAPKVDKEVLMPLADLDREWNRVEARPANPLADAVLRSKRAAKWSETYAKAFLDLKDADDRLHPSIGALQARTARMSVSRPPLQQLPSSDWRIRRAFIADPGQLIIAADYQAVEMRVLAALANVPSMKRAIAEGADLHEFTARLVLGDAVWEAMEPAAQKKARKLYKGVGFGKVYGGGAVTLARQTGAAVEAVRGATAGYDRVMPEIKRYSRRLMNRAEFGKKEVITPSGRHLPLDRDRLYAATNYVVQSTARDLLAQAVVDVFDAGLGDHLLLPIHDELLAQAPERDAGDVIQEIGRVMESTFQGVAIETDAEVVGPSWGHGYGAPL